MTVHTDHQPFSGTPRPLGRHVEHDSRSRAFGFAPQAPLPVRSKTWRRYGNALNQGDLGSCTGNAFTHALNSAPNHVSRTPIHGQAFAVSIYSAATRLDEFPGEYKPTDTGSSALGIAKAATAAGYIREYRWGFGFDHTLQTLMSGPVMIGTWWTQDMFYPDAKGFVRPTGAKAGGHEYLLVGVWLTQRVLIFQNSWGSGWGLRKSGRFLMRFDDFRPLLADDGDAMLPIPVGGLSA